MKKLLLITLGLLLCSASWAISAETNLQSTKVIEGLKGQVGKAGTFNTIHLANDASPSDGDVLSWNTGDTATWEAGGGGSGDVTASGTPVDNQVAVWTDASTIEGDADFTFTGGTITLGGLAKVLANADTSGVLTLGGVGGSNNENITLDFESVANRVDIASTTGVNTLKLSSIGFALTDDQPVQLGSGADIKLMWRTTGLDNLQLGTGVGTATRTGYISLMDVLDIGNANRDPSSPSADPVFRIYSSDATSATDYLEFYHDQTDAVIDWAAGGLSFLNSSGSVNPLVYFDSANDRVGIGIATPGTSLDVLGDTLQLTSKTGDATFRIRNSTATQIMTIDQNSLRSTTNNDVAIFTNGNNPQLLLQQSSGNVGINETSPLSTLTVGGNISIIESGDVRADAGLTDNSLTIWSDDVAGGASDYLRLYHDQTDAVIDWGAGDLKLLNTAGGTVDLTGTLTLEDTTSSTTGVIYKGTDRFIHNFAVSGTTGNNVFIGIDAGNFTMTGSTTGDEGSNLVGIGSRVLEDNTTGNNNLAVGFGALANNTTGGSNSAMGSRALSVNTTGDNNVALGTSALRYNETASNNMAIGAYSLDANTTGAANVGIGVNALGENTVGYNNVAIGLSAFRKNITGFINVAIGDGAGRYIAGGAVANTTSDYCTFIGADTDASADGVQRETVIGYNAIGKGTDTVILGADGTNTDVYASGALHVDSNAVDTTAIVTVENTGGDFQVFRDDASPEGVITGSIGDLCIDSTGGVLYIKETGSATNTGWQILDSGGSSGDITQVWTDVTGDVSAMTAGAGDTLDASGADSTIPIEVDTTAAPTTEGEMIWDSDDDIMAIGDGAGTDYFAKGASDGDALAGDSATSFFDTGTLEHEVGGLEADVSAYNGLVRIASGSTTNITDLSGLNTALGSSIADGAHTSAIPALTQEQVEDYAGALINDGTGTHTRVTVTYQDGTGDIDFVVDDMNDDVPESGDFGNAADLDADGSVSADSVALTTDTTGNYAAGDGEAGAALTGDAAVDFFGAGVDAVTDATTCTDVEGTLLSITAGTLNADVNTADIGDVSVTATELAELETIGATTISANQWTALGGIAETLTFTELDLLDGITVLSGSNTGDEVAADLTTSGVIEIATAAETTTGTDATRAVSPDGLAESDYGKRVVGVLVNDATALTSGDGKVYFARMPSIYNGWEIVEVSANIVAGTGLVTVMIHNLTQSADILSTALTIDANEKDSSTAVTAAVISGTEDDITTADRYRIDVDGEGTGTTWLEVQMVLKNPS